MNIQQLNDSGLSIWTFFVTAVVLLLLTEGLWLCIAEVNGYRTWSTRDRPEGGPERFPPGPTFSIAVRFRMLVWLYHHRYWTWARKTKAWWYILANSRHDDRWNPEIIDSSDGLLPAGEYVSKYMGSVHEYRAFRVN